MDAEAAAALVEESAKRSGLVWVRRADTGADQARPMWHVWSDGAVYVLTGGGEQPLPEGVADGGRAEVTVPSKDKRSRLAVWNATVSEVRAGTPEWDAIVPVLQAGRLNAPDGEAAPLRWAEQSQVWRLLRDGDLVEDPSSPSTGSHATAPVASPATTAVPVPWYAFGRRRRDRAVARRSVANARSDPG